MGSMTDATILAPLNGLLLCWKSHDALCLRFILCHEYSSTGPVLATWSRWDCPSVSLLTDNMILPRLPDRQENNPPIQVFAGHIVRGDTELNSGGLLCGVLGPVCPGVCTAVAVGVLGAVCDGMIRAK